MQDNKNKYELAFGYLMAKTRRTKGLTQAEVAELLGITQAYYSQLENAQRSIDLYLAVKACKTLGIDLNEFSRIYE